MKREMSIYVHIPFCVRKCNYCDFLSFCAEKDLIERYFEALKEEVRLASEKKNDKPLVRSIFFGGGTPSFVDAELICDVLETISSSFDLAKDAEISIEVNPASAMLEKLVAYRKAGFNRISIGAQSLNDSELKMLGRVHDCAMFYETFENARKAGFTNINVDVMSALPNQSLDSYVTTLKKVIDLKPEHISAYSLIVEEGTPFYEMDLELPDEDTDRAMYHETKRILEKAGYHRYEISNYALEGYECRHNKVYWRRGDYLGLGLGAASMIDNLRWSNIRDIGEYIDALRSSSSLEIHDGSFAIDNQCVEDSCLAKIRTDTEKLSGKSQMEEFMFLGLRLVEGVSTNEFRQQFGCDLEEVYADVIRKYIEMGLLEYAKRSGMPDSAIDDSCNSLQTDDGNEPTPVRYDTYLRLTERGLDVSNTVMADFLLD